MLLPVRFLSFLGAYGKSRMATESLKGICSDFRRDRGSDIIQLLVSIYDSKDVFVKELQVLLAQRLLAIKDYSLEKEVRFTSLS